jgi:mannose-6-phosphate isomerase-like protein (cupin superfamily)
VPDLLIPIHAPATAGERFDFGTHCNDFLVAREAALATEVFTVSVPGGGCVPLHVHPDMEQTFLFLSGVGEAFLARGGAERRCVCRPGDVLFVPTGWHHQVSAPGPEGVLYLTVNAFVPQVARIGGTALGHAKIADEGFDRTTAAAAAPGALEVARCAEARFRPDAGGARVWPDDGPLDATLTRPPGSYRVRRLGPFEYATPVTPVPRLLDAALADELHALAGGLPAFAEGSQSPLSAKPPHAGSDLDVLLAVSSPDDLSAARAAVDRLAQFARQRDLPLSPAVIHPCWLTLPGFYSAVDLNPASSERQWFTASAEQRLREAARRQQESLARLEHPEQVADLLAQSLATAGRTDTVQEWRITPRWQGYL